MLYFNQGNTSSCSADSDCGSGFLCGGKTGTGSTGKCFLAGRCLTTSTVNGESVITNVAPLGPGGGSCTGACTDVMQYAWTNGTSGLVNVIGREDALSNYTSVAYNSNGTPSQIGYGDTDSDPTNGGTNRTVYLFYTTGYPGRIAEVRRKSDLSTAGCDASTTTGCDRTIYTYDSDHYTLTSIAHTGFTLGSDGSVSSSAVSLGTIAYKYDWDVGYTLEVGRVAEIDKTDGASTTFNKTVFEYYYSASNPLNEAFLQDYKIYKDGSNYLEPQVLAYDFWGHPISVKDPNANFTCDTYDSARGFLASRRRAMNGQTDCSTTNSLDLTTSWARDSWLRLTQLTRPDGSCVFYSYDTSGRAYQIKRRDDCSSSSSGDTQQFSYTPDSQVSEIDTYDSSSTLTAKQPYTYFDSRRLQEIVNPVDTSKFTGLVYDSAGKVTEVDGASSLSKTVYHFDTSTAPGRDSRVTSEERYKTSSTSDTWSLLYAWLGDQAQVTDGDSKVTGSTRDDASRLVKIASPDLANPTIRVFDAASRLTTTVEDLGGTGQQTHTSTYDYMNRPLNNDYDNTWCSGSTHPEIQRTYDALPTGMTCPETGSCQNLEGHLAYVVTSLLCDGSSDHTLDQYTWYSYDDAGRVVEEIIKDDSGRAADQLYAYTKNGALSQTTAPSGAVLGWTYGSTGNNSDTDLVTGMWRTNTSTPIVDTVLWYPFGPLERYNWEASYADGGTQYLSTWLTRNLAYRITQVLNGWYQSGSSGFRSVTISEDAMGRVTSRVYSPHDPTTAGLYDSYFLYDEQSRVTCETTTSQTTCPTTGGASALKNNHSLSPPFMNAGDWKQILRQIPGSSSGLTNNFNSSGTGYGSSHQVTDINQSDGTPSFGHTAIAYDQRGNRSYDDNTTTLTNDRRDYTYDGRRNVINVRGQYYTGSAWHYYDVASAFDHKNRRVFKSFYDETTAKTAQWFFYYDPMDRLTEVRYTPDISTLTTYSLFQLFWLGDRLTLYWQTDYPSATTSKRYTGTDETGRINELFNWPSSGNAATYWGINQTAWGMDTPIAWGYSIYQPMLFTGQYQDTETAAYENDGATIHRTGLALNKFRTYDPFAGEYLQLDPLVDESWSSYTYVKSDPVGQVDPTGLCGVYLCDWGFCIDDSGCLGGDDSGGGGGPSSSGGEGGTMGGSSGGICAGCYAAPGSSTWWDAYNKPSCNCPSALNCDVDDSGFGDITKTCTIGPPPNVVKALWTSTRWKWCELAVGTAFAAVLGGITIECVVHDGACTGPACDAGSQAGKVISCSALFGGFAGLGTALFVSRFACDSTTTGSCPSGYKMITDQNECAILEDGVACCKKNPPSAAAQ